MADFGYECWELDALRPDVIDGLIRNAVTQLCDLDLLEEARGREKKAKYALEAVADDWRNIESKYTKGDEN